jgi:hypothetical protein
VGEVVAKDADGRGATWFFERLGAKLKGLPQVVRVAAGCYSVVALFSVAFWLVALASPRAFHGQDCRCRDFDHWPVPVGAALATSDRNQAFGFEITLARFEVGVGGEVLAAGITTEVLLHPIAVGSVCPPPVRRGRRACVWLSLEPPAEVGHKREGFIPSFLRSPCGR